MKPRVKTSCTANRYAGPDERIIEFFDRETQLGGLISFRSLPGRALEVACYRLDAGVRVTAPPANLERYALTIDRETLAEQMDLLGTVVADLMDGKTAKIAPKHRDALAGVVSLLDAIADQGTEDLDND